MEGKTSLLDSLIATPPSGNNRITTSIRPSLLSTLFEDIRPMFLSAIASVFVASVAVFRLQQTWTVLWLAADVSLLVARLGIARAYAARSRTEANCAERWAARYAPVSLLACLLLGVGAMGCVMSTDTELSSLSVMVTAGILGGIASRNAALPRLAFTQICLGALPIGLGALLAARSASWILVPPLFVYIAAMRSVVQRHYQGLVALMTAQQRNAELATRFDAALTHMPHGLCTIDEAGTVIVANRRTAELFGAPVEALKLNTPLPEFIGCLGLGKFDEPLRKGMVELCGRWLSMEPAPLDVKLSDGRQLEMTRHPVPDGSAVIIIEDVTARRQAELKILYLARHDSLTGLPNRRELRDRLERMLAKRAKGHGSALAVMYLDLDGFKPVNDKLGHYAGDEVLVSAANRLAKMLQRGELAARLGGDEFAVVVEDTSPAACSELARQIIRRISEPYLLSTGGTVCIGISIGIALAADGDSFERLIKRSDTALYSAKAAGKGAFRFFGGMAESGPVMHDATSSSSGTCQ